ncbi:MAG TPA: EF-hand domain-containing protein [Sphingomicrobium sp.]|nr:EF-hand domain-containing protein [Sphingomicrobium sp.]
MNVALPLIAIAALGAKPVQEESPITVTAHPWAPFISPMGEPFRAHSTSDDTLAAWFRKADRNNDGKLTVDEMVADAERFFATLDTNHDGQIDPDELNHYEWDVAPEIQVNSRTRRRPGEAVPLAAANGNDEDLRGKRHRRSDDGDSALGLNGALQGAARYGLLNIPEPVAAADSDFNRAISLEEFRQAAIERFRLLDTGHQGKITLEQLEVLRRQLQDAAARRGHGASEWDDRLGNPVPKQP